MATHLLRSPAFLLRSSAAIPFTGKPLSSAAAATATVPDILGFGQPKPEPLKPKHFPDLDLSDEARLFSGVPTAELLRSSAVLHAAAIGPMIDLGSWVLNSRLMDVPATREIVLGIVRRTFYEHFCAGEDAAAAGRRVRRVYESTGLKGMLVYGVEHSDDGGACDDNMRRFLETVEAARGVPSNCVSSVVVKITAICPISVLKRVSDLLRWQYKNPSFNLPWKLKTFPVFSGSSPLYHTNTKPEHLTGEEETELENAHERLRTICRACQETNVPLVIDAEDTILQPAIDYVAYWSAIVFNSDKNRPTVYNTVQAYLKDAGERLRLALGEAERLGVPMGFKLVRGAYMSSERRLASALGCKSPVHESIEETHACYNECMSLLLEKVASGGSGVGVGVVLATHNADSGKLAAKKVSDLGIERGERRIEFAQLYGMSDALSLGLKKAGFNVSKYMPFGPVQTAIPYLLRRADENRGMLATSTLDRQLMRKELQRRLKAAIL